MRLILIDSTGLGVLTRQRKKQDLSVIVKFARYNVRSRVFREKQKLKGTGLTTKRNGLLNDAREKYGFNSV